MQAVFNGVVKVVALKERVFGPKDHPASPEARATLSLLKSSVQSFFKDKTLEQMRAEVEKMSKMISPPSQYQITEADCFGTKALLCELKGLSKQDAIYVIHFHGGGLVVGSAHSAKVAVLPIFQRLPANMLIVDYRLCPENSPTEAYEDGLNAYRYLVETLKVDPWRITIAGESAGGNVVVGAALRILRDKSLPPPACLVGWSSWFDLTMETESVRWKDAADTNTTESLEMLANYIPKDVSRSAVSFHRADLTGLPPIFVSAGGHELLIHENQIFAETAQKCGVKVVTDFPEGLFHIFQLQTVIPEGKCTQDMTFAFIREHCKSPVGAEGGASG